MTCQSCVNDISNSLHKLSGIRKIEANLKDQLVTIEGTGSSHFRLAGDSRSGSFAHTYLAAPSAIVAAIQATGRDAILRGTGASNGR